MDPRLIIVAAIADNGVIGRDGQLPWRMKSDLMRFKTLTEDHAVVMGRRTWESILARNGKPLSNRTSIVLTSDLNYRVPDGGLVRHSLEDVLYKYPRSHGTDTIFVIGGARLFAEALPIADEIHLTKVHCSPLGDVFFPGVRDDRFVTTDRMLFGGDAQNEYDYTFCVYHRILPPPSKVYLPNARTPQQWAIMERIQMDGVCPFCPRHIARYHKEPIIKENADWLLTKNQWPYENTRHHFLLIARRHVESLHDLPPGAWVTMGDMAAFAEKEFDIAGGQLKLRFGDPSLNGGTVRHLHVQLVSK